MAFFRRRSISSALPLVVRAVQRNHHRYALFTALYHTCLSHKPSLRPFASTLHFYSSSAKGANPDHDLLRSIKSKIKDAQKSNEAIYASTSGKCNGMSRVGKRSRNMNHCRASKIILCLHPVSLYSSDMQKKDLVIE